MKQCIILCCYFFTIHTNFAQPNYIYRGGIGGGYSALEINTVNTLLFEGGISDGYAAFFYTNQDYYIFEGGTSDGYAVSKFINNINYLFNGGSGDGFAQSQFQISNNFLYAGGENQGYSQASKCEDFIWTGTIGTGWLVAGNWNYNMVPSLKRKVIIPNGTPYPPALHAGIFAIGDNPNNGQFKCGELWIQDGAFLITRINNRVENYGKIIIDGTMLVRKTTVDAFQNFTEGSINITSTGSLLIKP